MKDWKTWVKAAGNRALRTVMQTFIAMVGPAVVMSEVNWKVVISASVLAGILSIAS